MLEIPIFTHFLLEVLAAFTGSFIFIFFILIFLRPRIKISSCIAQSIDSFEENKIVYSIKVLNRSVFSGYELVAELNEVITIPVDGGENKRYMKLALKTNKSSHIMPYRPSWLKKNYGKNAIQLRTYDNVFDIINVPLKSVQIQITLKHGLTGLTKVFKKDYSVPGKIREGSFVFGNSFDIV